MNSLHIALCGYMGSGKTTVGKLLSERLNIRFVDLDEAIAIQEQMPISDIFDKKGEIYFRKTEHVTLQKILSEERDILLALGGGTPCYGNNLDLLQEKTQLVYLKTDLKTLTDRLFAQKNTRPLIAHYDEKKDLEEFVRKHLFERNYFYLQSDKIIETNGRSAEHLAEEIARVLK